MFKTIKDALETPQKKIQNLTERNKQLEKELANAKKYIALLENKKKVPPPQGDAMR